MPVSGNPFFMSILFDHFLIPYDFDWEWFLEAVGLGVQICWLFFSSDFMLGLILFYIVGLSWGVKLCGFDRANAQQPKLFVGMILILIFAEALALYGLIVGIILSSRSGQSRAD